MTQARFENQVALVTGASRGIGAQIALSLARRGAHIVLTARNGEELEAVEEKIHEAGGNATIAPLDLTETDSIARLAEAIGSRWEALDILVLNAAMLGSLGPVPSIDGKEFNKLITLNLMAQQALVAAFDPMLRKSKNARVFALTSSVGGNPRAFWGAYGASKAALETLITSYGAEIGKISNIRTALVDPGRTRTNMRANAYPGEDPMTLKTPDVVGEAVANLAASDFETGFRLEIEG